MRHLSLEEPRPFYWTRTQYYRLLSDGYFQDRRVELIHGEILESPRPSEFRFVGIALSADALRAAFGPGHWIREQAALNLAPDSDPEFTLAVVAGTPRRPGGDRDHPKTALLVLQVSDTTLTYERSFRSGLCAAAGIADYWIVNLVDRQLEVYRSPVVDTAALFGFRYSSVTIFDPTDFVVPLAAPAARIAVVDLLP